MAEKPSKAYPAKVFFHTRTPQDLLTAGYDSLRIQKRVNRASAWGDVLLSQPQKDDLALLTDKYNYHFVDPTSQVGNEYRAVLQNSSTPGTPPDVFQPPAKAVDLAFEQVMTVQEFKEIYLWGQDSAFITDEGKFQPDYVFAFYVIYGIRRVEAALDIKLMPTRCEDVRDWDPASWGAGFIQLYLSQFPVLSVESVTLDLPASDPYVYDPTWLRLDKAAGRLSIVPTSVGMFPGSIIPRMNGYIPQALRVDYFAGFEGAPHDLREAVGKEGALPALNVGGDLVGGAGLAGTSISMDGLSQSVTTTNSSTNAGFGARILMYNKDLQRLYKDLRPYYKGIKMAVG